MEIRFPFFSGSFNGFRHCVRFRRALSASARGRSTFIRWRQIRAGCSHMPDGGTRFGAPGYEEACPQKVHRVLGPRRYNQRQDAPWALQARWPFYSLKTVSRETAASTRGFSPVPQIIRRERPPAARGEANPFAPLSPPLPCWYANN